MRRLLTVVTFLGLSCIACAQAFAGTGIFYRPSDLATSMLTNATVGDAIVDDLVRRQRPHEWRQPVIRWTTTSRTPASPARSLGIPD